MLATLAAVLLTADPGPPKIAVIDFRCSGRNIDNALCDAWVDRFLARLAGSGVKIVTQRDLADALGLERQKQLLGCVEDDAQCQLDLGQALAVDGILSGSVVQPLDGYLLSIKVVRPTDGSRVMASSRTLANQADLLEALDTEALRIGGRLAGRSSRSRLIGILGIAGGGAFIVAGGLLFGLAKVEAGRLRSTQPLSSDEVRGAVSRGSTMQPLGLTLLGLGIPTLIVGALWLALGYDSAHSVALSLTPDGAAFALGMSWP